jgi:hypothetical protein
MEGAGEGLAADQPGRGLLDAGSMSLPGASTCMPLQCVVGLSEPACKA